MLIDRNSNFSLRSPFCVWLCDFLMCVKHDKLYFCWYECSFCCCCCINMLASAECDEDMFNVVKHCEKSQCNSETITPKQQLQQGIICIWFEFGAGSPVKHTHTDTSIWTVSNFAFSVVRVDITTPGENSDQRICIQNYQRQMMTISPVSLFLSLSLSHTLSPLVYFRSSLSVANPSRGEKTRRSNFPSRKKSNIMCVCVCIDWLSSFDMNFYYPILLLWSMGAQLIEYG